MTYGVEHHRWLAGGRLASTWTEVEAGSPEAAIEVVRASSGTVRLTDARVSRVTPTTFRRTSTRGPGTDAGPWRRAESAKRGSRARSTSTTPGTHGQARERAARHPLEGPQPDTAVEVGARLTPGG